MWWSDTAIQKEIGLAPDVAKKIDEAWQAWVKRSKPVFDRYDQEQEVLAKLTRDAMVEPEQYRVQLGIVEGLRSMLNISRLEMVYRITKMLKPEQNKKLQDYFERQAALRQQGGPGANPNGRGRQ